MENRFPYSRHRGSTLERVTLRKFYRSSSGSYSFHPIERGPPTVWCVFFSKWKRTLNFFGQRRDNNDSYNDPSFALDFDEEKRSLHFYEILHPLRQPSSLPLSVSLPPCFILACTSQVTLAPCFLRARSVAAFCSAHRRGIPARQFIRKVFFAFSGLSPQTTHHRALVHTVFQALPRRLARGYTLAHARIVAQMRQENGMPSRSCAFPAWPLEIPN